MTGSSTSAGGDYDYLTLAYSRDGVPLWTNRFGGIAGGEDPALGIAVDDGGTVLVTGQSRNASGAFHFVTLALASGSGLPLWTNRYNGPANGDDVPRGIASGSNGSVYMTGWSNSDPGPNTVTDFLTVNTQSMLPPRVVTPTTTNAVARWHGNATFTLVAAGTMPLDYQWLRDGAFLSATATNRGLTLTNLTGADQGAALRVVITESLWQRDEQRVMNVSLLLPPEYNQLRSALLPNGQLRLNLLGETSGVYVLDRTPNLSRRPGCRSSATSPHRTETDMQSIAADRHE